MEKEGWSCTSISGELDHARRDAVINEFRTGITKVLIATDVLARGFDVQQVTCVQSLRMRLLAHLLLAKIVSRSIFMLNCLGSTLNMHITSKLGSVRISTPMRHHEFVYLLHDARMLA